MQCGCNYVQGKKAKFEVIFLGGFTAPTMMVLFLLGSPLDSAFLVWNVGKSSDKENQPELF